MDQCKRSEFSDAPLLGEHISLNVALVLQRDGDDHHAITRTNVPHLVAHHSPSGFEWGYGGSGPADLALNICQWYLNSIGYEGQKSQCFDGISSPMRPTRESPFQWWRSRHGLMRISPTI